MNVRPDFWPSGKAPRFPGPMPGESSAVPTEFCRHRRQPDQNRHNTTHKSRSHRWEAQATRHVLLLEKPQVGGEARVSLPAGSTGSKTGGYQSEKGDEKRPYRGSHHDPTNGRNPCVFRSDGAFGNHSSVLTAGKIGATGGICSRVVKTTKQLREFLLAGVYRWTSNGRGPGPVSLSEITSRCYSGNKIA
jgi:hypothetical protein